ncbi:hypothetical protein C8T65DRAFT_700006 [Cerioporus squamosus]|nr:hypothetical protein C8T65DRAFT_700006 [Cerioporus squamosus]
MPGSPPPDGIHLTHDEIDRLRDVLETWASKSRAEKREKKEALVDEFLRGRDVDETNRYAREFLRMKITHWFSNNAPTKDTRLPRSLRTVWTAREVFNIRRQDAVAERQQEILANGEKTATIAALNAARAELWAALEDEEKEEFEREADEWTFEGPDPALRTMIAEKRLADWVASFITLLWNQAGAISELTFYYLDRMAKLKWGRYDISMHWHRDDPKNPMFTELYPDWKSDYLGHYSRYANMTLFPGTHDVENEKGLRRKPVEVEVVFDVYPDGTPILPPISEYRLQTSKEAVMRTFMNLHWSLACGVKDTPVAWGEVAARPDQYFRAGLFPDVQVVEPTRMNSKPMAKWWARVIELQENDDPEERFRFMHWWDGSERHVAEYTGVAQEKNMAKAKNERRLRVANGPPKGAFEAWTGQRPPPGQPGTSSSGNPDHEDSGSDSAEEVITGEKRKKVLKASKGKGKETVATAKSKGAGKGKEKELAARPKSKRPRKKARTVHDGSSDSAKSSGAGSNGSGSPHLDSDDSPEDEEFDLDNISGSEDGAPPLAATRRSGRGRKAAPRQDGTMPNDINPASSPLQPLANLPKPGQGSPGALVQPDSSLVARAKEKAPRWVGKTDARVWPFLWALCEDVNYRRALSVWRHTLGSRMTFSSPGPGRWASWDSKDWGLPAAVHRTRDRLDAVFSWL